MASYQPPYGPGYFPPPAQGWNQPPYPQPTYGYPPVAHTPTPVPQPSGPPFKKQKSNPVITKYPPPPAGWKPRQQAAPYQPQAATYASTPYTAPAHAAYHVPQPSQQPHVPQYAQAPYNYPAHQPSSTPAYQQPGYQVDPSHAYQHAYYQNRYAATSAYTPPVSAYAAPPQAYTAPPQAYNVQPYTAPAPNQPGQQHAGYDHANGARPVSQPSYAPSTAALPKSAPSSVTGMPIEVPANHARKASITYSDMEFGFEGEGEGISLTDEIDARFSLGLIIWQSAERKKRPLPSTFDEAELQSVVPAIPPEDPVESVSVYFTSSNEKEVVMSIRDTEEWATVKDDFIFADLSQSGEVVPFAAVINNRKRPDVGVSESKPMQEEPSNQEDQARAGAQLRGPAPHAMLQAPQDEFEESDGDQAMDMSEASEDEHVPERPQVSFQKSDSTQLRLTSKPIHGLAKQNKALDGLDRALSPRDQFQPSGISKLPSSARQLRSRSPEKSRSRSPQKNSRSRQGSHQPKQKPVSHARDPNQESLLAALGVEGSPKAVFPTPPPALAPPSPDRAKSPERFGPLPHVMHQAPARLYGPHFPPPPPPREPRSPSLDPWKQHEAINGNSRRNRSPSAASQHTAAGSDFHEEDMDATPRAKPPPPPPPPSQGRSYGLKSGRKRAWDRSDDEGDGKRRRQPDDTPKARRKNYDRTDAYSRRW